MNSDHIVIYLKSDKDARQYMSGTFHFVGDEYDLLASKLMAADIQHLMDNNVQYELRYTGGCCEEPLTLAEIELVENRLKVCEEIGTIKGVLKTYTSIRKITGNKWHDIFNFEKLKITETIDSLDILYDGVTYNLPIVKTLITDIINIVGMIAGALYLPVSDVDPNVQRYLDRNSIEPK